MALNYTSSLISVGNGNFGIASNQTLLTLGSTFLDNRFLLILVKSSGGTLAWKKVDTLAAVTTVYDMLYTPESAGIALGDHTTQGSFLHVEGNYMYYYKDAVILRRNLADGSAAGTHTLTGGATSGTTQAFVLKGTNAYLVSKADGKIFRYDMTGWAWDNTAKAATNFVTVSEFSTYNVVGAFTQLGSNDLVVALKGAAKIAVKYTAALSARVGTHSSWTDPSTSIVAGVFNGTILHLIKSDDTQAGTGVTILRFGDASTDIADKEQTTMTLSTDRVKVGSGQVVTITFAAKDGYGKIFEPTEKARFSIVRVGDVFDRNDGALAVASTGPFRAINGNPLATSLDVSFDVNGVAVCYWQTPLEIPTEEMLQRIKVYYPIF